MSVITALRLNSSRGSFGVLALVVSLPLFGVLRYRFRTSSASLQTFYRSAYIAIGWSSWPCLHDLFLFTRRALATLDRSEIGLCNLYTTCNVKITLHWTKARNLLLCVRGYNV